MFSSKKSLIWYETNRGGETKATESLINEIKKIRSLEIISRRPMVNNSFFPFFIWLLKEFFECWKVLRSNGLLSIVYTPTFTACFISTVHKYFYGYPKCIWHYHGNRLPEHPRYVKGYKKKLTQLIKYDVIYFCHTIALNGVSKVIVTSNRTMKFLLNTFRLNHEKVVLIKNGVDQSIFSPRSKKDKQKILKLLKIKSDAFVIAYVGRLDISKGIFRLLTVFSIVSKILPNCILLINYLPPITESEKKIEIKVKKIAKLGSNIVLMKNWPVTQIYSAADLVVSFSNLEYASPSLLVLESLNSQRLIFTTNQDQKDFLTPLCLKLYADQNTTNNILAKKIVYLLQISDYRKDRFFKSIKQNLKEFSKELWFKKVYLQITDLV